MWTVAAIVLAAMMLMSKHEEPAETRMLTKLELRSYGGHGSKPSYLAIGGKVFDVSKGARFYGKGGGYSHFVGRDASRGFITGDFKGDLTDNVADFTPEQFAGLAEWIRFYHKEYTYKGRLVGAFYDIKGKPTDQLKKAQTAAQQAKTNEQLIRESEASYPRCNVRWSDRDGGHVSCDGENTRPRKIFVQLPGGKPATRCACMQGDGWSDVRQVYPGCSPSAQVCQTSPPSKPAQQQVQEQLQEEKAEEQAGTEHGGMEQQPQQTGGLPAGQTEHVEL
ncbi:hypothetical protein FOA52_000929 [Chlamydomonas sp. UWO 241]|nr:hypothetical protein FOA52_000929 [Chlamydomonas sp. UWO 241]